MTVTVTTQSNNRVRKAYQANSVQTGAFVVEDRSNYVINLPTSAVASGTLIDQIHQYLPAKVASATSGTSGDPISLFRQEPTTNLGGWGRPWNSSIIEPARLVIDLGVEIDVREIQYYGPISTGYVNLSSGCRSVTTRFSKTGALSTVYNNMTNVEKSFTNEWVNGYNTPLNTAGPDGLTGSLNIYALNGNVALMARYIAFDVATTWDEHNMAINRIRFKERTTQTDVGTTLTLDAVGPSVNEFSIIDGNGNFNEGSAVSVVVGADTVRLSKPGRYDFVRVGTKFLVFSQGRKIAEASI